MIMKYEIECGRDSKNLMSSSESERKQAQLGSLSATSGS
jgi:hypothetical protein